jgi:hypothetical protein
VLWDLRDNGIDFFDDEHFGTEIPFSLQLLELFCVESQYVWAKKKAP